MGPLFKAIIPAALLTEIAAIVFFTATWSILAEMHFGQSVILGGEAVTAIGVVAIGRAFSADLCIGRIGYYRKQ